MSTAANFSILKSNIPQRWHGDHAGCSAHGEVDREGIMVRGLDCALRDIQRGQSATVEHMVDAEIEVPGVIGYHRPETD